MNKEYFDTDSTGKQKYFNDQDGKNVKSKEDIKKFIINTDNYKKTEVKTEIKKYAIKD